MSQSLRRRRHLVELLQIRGSMSVDDIRSATGVGIATVRRDLQVLSKEGHLVRTYGGAIPARRNSTGQRLGENAIHKHHIAAAAAELLADRSSLAVSGGSTTMAFAQYVAHRRDLTVVTNSLDVAQVMSHASGVDLVVLGGSYRPESGSLLGHLTEQASQSLLVDAVVMGIGAISTRHGFMNDHLQEVVTDRALHRMGEEVVVLADASKFQRVASVVVLGLSDVACVVTDSRVTPRVVDELTSAGVKVVVAPPREANLVPTDRKPLAHGPKGDG